MANYYGGSNGSDRWDNRDRNNGYGHSSSSDYDRYAPSSSSNDRYGSSSGGDRYGPPSGGDRYGPGGGSSYDRYGPSSGGDRYGSSGGGGWGDRSGDSMAGLGGGLSNIQWDISRLPVFEKNFYIEHPDVSKRSDREADDWRRSVDITVIGRGIPKVPISLIA